MTQYSIIKSKTSIAGSAIHTKLRIRIGAGFFPLNEPSGYVWREKMIGVGDEYEELRLARCESIHRVGTGHVRLMGEYAIPFQLEEGEEYITDKAMNELSSINIEDAA